MTQQDVQRYLRIILQYIASALTTYGFITPGATWVPTAIGIAVGVGTFGWTLFGNRIQAKIDEIKAILAAPEASLEAKAAVTAAVAKLPQVETITLAKTDEAVIIGSLTPGNVVIPR